MNQIRHRDFEDVLAPEFFMTILDRSGDTTVTWSEPDDVEVLTYIQKKMDEGFVFFMERPKVVRAFMKKKKIDSVSEVKERKLFLADEDAAKLELAGKLKLITIEQPETPAPVVKKAKTAKEVSRGRSHAVRPMAGG